MDKRNRFPAAIFIPVLLAVLAFPAWAGPPGGKPGHYPGQDCSGCHKIRGKSTGKAPGKTTPAVTNPAKTTPAKTTPAKTTPAKGATQPR